MPEHRPQTVLYVLNSPSIGGANRSLTVLLTGLDRSRFRPIAVMPKDGPMAERLRTLGVPFDILPLPSLGRLSASPMGKVRAAVRNARNLFRLAALMRRENVRLVHTNTIFPLGGALVAGVLGRPHVWHIREGMDWSGYDLRFGRRGSQWLMAALSARMICISEYVRRSSVIARARGRARVIYNALEGNPAPRDAANLDAPVIGCVGLLSRKKRTGLFVEVAARIAARHPGARFIAAGSPPSGEESYATACRERASALGLAERLEWPGFVADASRLFRDLDLLIHPAVAEGFGRVLIEAMAHGIPVVSVRSGAVPEIVDDPETGRVVDPDDADALASAALDLLGREESYHATAAAARRQTLHRFDPVRHVRAVTDVYDELLGPTAVA